MNIYIIYISEMRIMEYFYKGDWFIGWFVGRQVGWLVDLYEHN